MNEEAQVNPQVQDTYLEAVRSLVRLGRVEEADRLLQLALGNAPEPAARYLLRRLSEQTPPDQEAATARERIKKNHRMLAERTRRLEAIARLLKKAEEFFAHDDGQKGTSLLENARKRAERLEDGDSRSKGLMMVGRAYMKIPAIEQAEHCFRDAIKTGENLAVCYENLGEMYTDYLHNKAEGLSAFTRAAELDGGRPVSAFQLQKAFLAQGKVEEARLVCRRLCESGRSQEVREQGLMGLADIEIQQGNMLAAEAYLAQLPEVEGHKPVKALIAVAKGQERRGAWEAAIRSYIRLAEWKHSNQANAYIRAAEIRLLYLNDPNGALKIIDNCIRDFPYDPHLYYLKAVALTEQKLPEDALVSVRKAQELKPGLVKAHLLAARVLSDLLDETENACKELERAKSFADDKETRLVIEATQKELQLEWDEAIQYHLQIAAESTESKYNSAAAYEHIGNLYRVQRHQPEDAIWAYDQALEKHPGRVSALFGKALALEQLGRWEEASQSYQAIARFSNTRRADAYANAAIALAHGGKSHEAEELLLEAEAELPNDPELLVARATVFEIQEDWEQAIRLHEQAAQSEKYRKAARLRIASITLAHSGDAQRALELFLSQLPEWQEDPINVIIQIARAEEALGNEEGIRKAFATYKDIEKRLRDLEKSPSKSDFRRLAWVKYKLGQFDHALEILDEIPLQKRGDVDTTRASVIQASIQFLRGENGATEQAIRNLVRWRELSDELAWEARHDLEAVARQYAPGLDTAPFFRWLGTG